MDGDPGCAGDIGGCPGCAEGIGDPGNPWGVEGIGNPGDPWGVEGIGDEAGKLGAAEATPNIEANTLAATSLPSG